MSAITRKIEQKDRSGFRVKFTGSREGKSCNREGNDSGREAQSQPRLHLLLRQRDEVAGNGVQL